MTEADSSEAEEAGQRLDKWLWCARFFKTRAMATRLIKAGHLRVDGVVMTKPHRQARCGMVLTFAHHFFNGEQQIRVIRIEALASRRGPAAEAVLLYHDLDPPEARRKPGKEPAPAAVGLRAAGSGRPTKRERRQLERLRQ